jgi:AraC-like DNA-binding protein
VWWLGQCSFSDRFRFDAFRLGVGVVWIGVVLLDLWRIQKGTVGPLDYLGVIIAAVLMVHLIWVLVSGRDDDLRTRRRDIRLWLPAVIIVLVFAAVIVDFTLGFSWRSFVMILTQNTVMFLLAIALALTTLHVDARQYAAGANAKLSIFAESKRSHNAQRIHRLMTEDKLFLQSNLRFSDIVDRLPISESRARALIHKEFGCEHFRTFLNRYRIEHAKSLMQDAEHVNDKLIGIAFDSGFASEASFQRAFKREIGTTPSDWRKRLR